MQAAPRAGFVTHAASRTLTTNQPSLTGVRPASSCWRRASSITLLPPLSLGGLRGSCDELLAVQRRRGPGVDPDVDELAGRSRADEIDGRISAGTATQERRVRAARP